MTQQEERRVYKYGTGDRIPEGAVYLTTIIEDAPNAPRLVWHYFLINEKVEVPLGPLL